MTQQRLILLHLPDGHRLVTGPAEIYYLEADGDDISYATRLYRHVPGP